LRRATVSSSGSWCPAVGEAEALVRLHEGDRTCSWSSGPFDALVGRALDAYPGLRIVVDRDVPSAASVVTSYAEVRDAVLDRPRPGGPVL
jgi:hypothetical protein